MPEKTLLGKPVTAEKLAAFFKKLKGRDATPEEMEKFKKSAEELAAKE